MKNQLQLNVPFTGFTNLDFISCFTSIYVYFEKIPLRGGDGRCVQSRGEGCNNCGNCGTSNPIRDLEPYHFLFDTMSGQSALRLRFDGEPTEMQKLIGETNEEGCGTDYTVDFLFGFAGYEYQKLTAADSFKEAIIASIDKGNPVIARVSGNNGRFRVITGYDNDTLICPSFINAQNKPGGAPSYNDLNTLYIIGDKITPCYGVLDGLKRIQKVMAYNIKENLWGGYTEKIGLYTSDSLNNCAIEEKKARMKRIADTMWHTFNCHNFAEVFRKYRDGNASVYENVADMKKLSNPVLHDLWNNIGGPCNGYTHDLAWALIGVDECADWTKHAAGYFGEMVELTIYRIRDNDKGAYEAINKAIKVLEK